MPDAGIHAVICIAYAIFVCVKSKRWPSRPVFVGCNIKYAKLVGQCSRHFNSNHTSVFSFLYFSGGYLNFLYVLPSQPFCVIFVVFRIY